MEVAKMVFGPIIVEPDKHDGTRNLAIKYVIKYKDYTHEMDYQQSNWFINKYFLSI